MQRLIFSIHWSFGNSCCLPRNGLDNFRSFGRLYSDKVFTSLLRFNLWVYSNTFVRCLLYYQSPKMRLTQYDALRKFSRMTKPDFLGPTTLHSHSPSPHNHDHSSRKRVKQSRKRNKAIVDSRLRPQWCFHLANVTELEEMLHCKLDALIRSFAWVKKRFSCQHKSARITWPLILTLTLSTPWMHADLESIVCKFGGDPAICLWELMVGANSHEFITLCTLLTNWLQYLAPPLSRAGEVISHVFFGFSKKRKKSKNVTVITCIVGLYKPRLLGLKTTLNHICWRLRNY